jgi:hypothetical protein
VSNEEEQGAWLRYKWLDWVLWSDDWVEYSSWVEKTYPRTEWARESVDTNPGQQVGYRHHVSTRNVKRQSSM